MKRYVLLICLVFFFTAYYLITISFKVTNVSIKFSSCIAPIIHELVTKEYYESKKIFLTDKAILDNLCIKFELIQEGSIRSYPFEKKITIVSRKPYCRINNDLILTLDKHILQKKLFIDDEINSLPHLLVSEKFFNQPGFLFNYLENLSFLFLSSYEISIVSSDYVKIVDKSSDCYLTIVVSMDQFITPYLISCCQRIKDDLYGGSFSGKETQWIIDVRFANYVIAYKQTGGRDGSIY